MNDEARPLPEQISALYKELAGNATTLNAATDELTLAITPLDGALAKLNLGIECWVRVYATGVAGGGFHHRELGYARVNRQWGISLREVEGHETLDEMTEERWRFNEAPRAHRVEALERIPELLQRLIKKSASATKKIQESTAQARAFSEAIRKAATDTPPPVKKKVVAPGGVR